MHAADCIRGVSELARLIERQIATAGPMTVADYMATALGHPQHGYYMNRDPFGRDGDFITAPEISQIFGELIGIWCVAVWRMMGVPSRFNLVELGPGRGTLMADALRATSQSQGFRQAANVALVETSPVLRAAQKRTLAAHEIVWCDSVDAVPDGPVLLIANEFFDALPVHQLVRTVDGWRERLVGQDGTGFRFMLSADATPATALLTSDIRTGAPVDSVAEVQPAGLAIAAAVADRIKSDGGAALIIDYGYAESAVGETLQAVRQHEPQDVLLMPGDADLTAHVDFAALGRATAGKATLCGPCGQGAFLQNLGIAIRAERLAEQATSSQAEDIASGVRRLIADDEMGSLFKVLGIASHDLSPLPGFGS